MDLSSQIDVKQYLSATQFLQDYYKLTKKIDKSFSYQVWADQLNISSKSYLRLALFGKRKISEELSQKFCDNLKMTELDREYFCLLVLYSQSAQAEQKKIYGRKLTQLLKNQIQVTTIEPNDDFLSDPLNMIIRNVLSYSDIDCSISNLAKIFLMSEANLEKKLIALEANGLVKKSGEKWHASHDVVKINSSPGHTGILKYHKQSLLKAIEAQTKYPIEQRNFRSVTIALNKNEFQEYQDDLNAFVQQVFTKYDGPELANRRVYQLNLNAIPWTLEPEKTIASDLAPELTI